MELVSVYDSKNAFYKVKDLNVTLHKSVMEPLNDMLKEFQNHYKSSGITIISGIVLMTIRNLYTSKR